MGKEAVFKRILFVVAVLGLLVFHIFLRFRTFYLPHFIGDQGAYVATAMKLDNEGFKGYNLQWVGIKRTKDFLLTAFFYPSQDKKGALIRMFEQDGVYAYDKPFYVIPPLFSVLIMQSHRLIGGGSKDEYIIALTLPKDKGLLGRIATTQMYAALIPFLGDFLTMLLLVAAGCRFYGRAVGVLAGAFFCISPTSIFATHRLMPDTVFTLLAFIALTACYYAQVQRRFFPAVLSGIFLGLSLLLKNAALLLVLPMAVMPFLVTDSARKGVRGFFGFRSIVMFMTALVIVLPWYSLVTAHYGRPVVALVQAASGTAEWFVRLNARPWYTFLVDIPYQMPFYLAGYFAVGSVLWGWRKAPGLDRMMTFIFLSFLAGMTLITVRDDMLGPENRYMLPAYPFLALLAAERVNRIRRNLISRGTRAALILFSVFIVVTVWSVCIAMPRAMKYQLPVIEVPF